MTDLLTDALALGRSLRARREVRSVCVLGSVARREIDRFSDVDLLAVIDPTVPGTGRPVKREIARRIGRHPVQMRVVTVERLARYRDERTMFAAHVARESRIAFDRGGYIRQIRRTFRPGVCVEESADALRRRAALYDELEWCNGHYLVCFADLYGFARAAAILGLAQRGIFEFGRAAPLRRFAESKPFLRGQAQTVMSLEPFYLRQRRSLEIPLPFAPSNTHAEARAARDACRAILSEVA